MRWCWLQRAYAAGSRICHDFPQFREPVVAAIFREKFFLEFRVGGKRVEAVEQRAQVHAAAANHQRQPAAGLNIRYCRLGQLDKTKDIDGLGDVQHVNQVVRDFPLFLGGGLGRSDVQAAVKLHGIGADDLPGKVPGKFEGKTAFAAGGRSHNDN